MPVHVRVAAPAEQLVFGPFSPEDRIEFERYVPLGSDSTPHLRISGNDESWQFDGATSFDDVELLAQVDGGDWSAQGGHPSTQTCSMRSVPAKRCVSRGSENRACGICDSGSRQQWQSLNGISPVSDPTVASQYNRYKKRSHRESLAEQDLHIPSGGHFEPR